jgi:protein SCO1
MTSLQQHSNGLSTSQKRGIYLTIGGVGVFIAIVIGIFIQGISNPRILSDSELTNNGFYRYEKPRSFKSFLLTDDSGQEFTQERFLGKWSLVFFGFTFCPDVCPTTLALLNQFYQQQQDKKFGDDLQIILVTVDPARDTPEKLHDYIKYFNPSFTGVTGEFLDIHRFATQLNIPFSKVPGGGDNYTVEHSGNVAVINDKGHYVGFFRAPMELAKLNLTYQSMRLTY